MINQYFSLVSEPIMLRNGVIDKYIGDAIMAFWGAPFTSEDEQAKLACLAALEQFDKLDELNGQMGDILGFRKGLPNVDIRIGLCTGEVVAGNIGSTQSRSYTLMGDTVNIAARLESANKQFGTRILMNEDTYLRIKDDFVTRHIDKIVVVGKYEPVEIYELVGKVGDVEQLVIEKIGAYHQALAAYRQQQWSEALGWIAKSQAILPSDGPSEVLKKRIHQLQQQNLPQNWDGVWRLTGK
jgi:adenylate cyclase